jgi:uridylate kinase
MAIQQLSEERLISKKVLEYARNQIAKAAGQSAVVVVKGGGEYRRRQIKRKAYEVAATEYMDR